jgi:hypothetical protein
LIALAVGIPKINNDPMALYMESKDHTKKFEAELKQENEELAADLDDLDADIEMVVPHDS